MHQRARTDLRGGRGETRVPTATHGNADLVTSSAGGTLQIPSRNPAIDSSGEETTQSLYAVHFRRRLPSVCITGCLLQASAVVGCQSRYLAIREPCCDDTHPAIYVVSPLARCKHMQLGYEVFLALLRKNRRLDRTSRPLAVASGARGYVSARITQLDHMNDGIWGT
jgi:hypothetical protein